MEYEDREFHVIMTDGQQVVQDAVLSAERIDQANSFLAHETDYYWATKHDAGECSKCCVPKETFWKESR